MLGERLAADHLEKCGYTVIHRNYRFGHREIDLIVQRGDLIAFVEVKTRAEMGYGHPLEAVTAQKRREIERVARRWVQQSGREGTLYRFDAVGVTLRRGGGAVIEHICDAWRLGE